jgi:hypothetical protein
MLRRTALFLLPITLACAPSASTPPRTGAASSDCMASALPACEAAVSRALRSGIDTEAATDSYLAARAEARGPDDAWVVLARRLQALSQASSPPVVMGAADQMQALAPQLRSSFRALRPADLSPAVVPSPDLPALSSLAPAELLLALARKARLGAVVWLRQQDVVVALGDDPLATVCYDLPPLWVESRAELGGEPAGQLARVLAVERATSELLRLLGKGQFREAAGVMSALDAMLASVSAARSTGLRARLLSGRRGMFGMQAAALPFPADSALEQRAEEPSRLAVASQGPYAAWLRVQLARSDDPEGWRRQRAAVSQGLTPERLAALDFLFDHDPSSSAARRCELSATPVPAEVLQGAPVFASKLAQLASSEAITPSQWARAYDATVARVEQTQTGWYMMAALLSQRGELPGLSTRGSSQYRRVTRMALEYLAALQAFQTAAPKLYQPAGQLVVALSPGARSDPELVPAVQQLVADSVQHRFVAASDSTAVLEQLVVTAISAMSLPDPVRSGYLRAAVQQGQAALQGPLGQGGGWGLALLHAAVALGQHLLGDQPDLAASAEPFGRALQSESATRTRPLAALAARLADYAALADSGELEPDKVGAVVGPKRAAARLQLLAALKEPGDNGERGPDAALEPLARLADGLIAAAVLAWKVPAAPRGRESQACDTERTHRAQVSRNLQELAKQRDLMTKDRWLSHGRGAASRRARLLFAIISDLLDAMSAPAGGKVSFRLSDAQVSDAVREGVAEWTSAEHGESAAALHALVRAGVRDGWKQVPDKHSRELAVALRGVFSWIGASPRAALSVPAGQGLAQYAESLHAAGHHDRASIALLLTTTSSPVGAAALRAEALAGQHDSALAWALGSRRMVHDTAVGAPLDAEAYETVLRTLSEDGCKRAQMAPVISLAHAVARFARGERETAARALDAWLDGAQGQGWAIPRVQYRLAEPVGTGKLGKLEVHMTPAQGFVSDTALSFGVEVLSGQRQPGLKVDVVTTDDQDTGRLFAHVAALGAVYHLLQGHDAAGTHDAIRALQAMSHGVRLGRRVSIPRTKDWAGDSVESLLVLYELAIERSQPLLAAEVLRRVPDGAQAPGATPESVGLRGLEGIGEFMGRAWQDVQLAKRARSCQGPGPQRAPSVSSCVQLRRATALWRAGAYSSPPALQAGARDKCSEDLSLLAILQALGAANSAVGVPEPMQAKAARWTARAVDSGHAHDAATVMRAARDAGVCTPLLGATARLAARRPLVTAADQVDWLTYALRCAGGGADEARWEDLARIGQAAARVPEQSVSSQVDAAIVRFMVDEQAWIRLHAFASRPEFLGRMNQAGPAGGATALAIEHASAVLSGKAPALESSREAYELACIRFGDAGRDALCRELGSLRHRIAREPAERLLDKSRALLRMVVDR